MKLSSLNYLINMIVRPSTPIHYFPFRQPWGVNQWNHGVWWIWENLNHKLPTIMLYQVLSSHLLLLKLQYHIQTGSFYKFLNCPSCFLQNHNLIAIDASLSFAPLRFQTVLLSPGHMFLAPLNNCRPSANGNSGISWNTLWQGKFPSNVVRMVFGCFYHEMLIESPSRRCVIN